MSRFLGELVRPWREDLAEIVDVGVRDGAFDWPGATGEFAVCFCALLDGLAILHLRQMPALPRQQVVELAMNTARERLAPAGQRDRG